MTLQEGRAISGRGITGPENTPRLRLKPKASTTGHVDGAWWPHSDDLARELPDLLAVLSVRLGAVDRVMYNLAEWPNTQARILVGGRPVRLDGYRRQPANTIEVLGIGRARILLLVVPVLSDPDHAHETMMRAAAPNNAQSADKLLSISAQDREIRDRTTATEQRWMAGAGAG